MVQRYTADGYGAQQGEMMPDPEGPWMLAADHARIVAEAGAAVFAFHPEWTVTGMCDSDCLACRRLTELITEREKGYEEGKADAEQAHAAALAEASGRFGGERPADLIHDGEATPLDNMGLRDRDEVENRLSSIRSLMLARPPRTTADALRALADDIQGAAIDGEATPQGKPCSTCGEPVAYLTARPGWAGGWLHHPARPLDGHPAAIDGEATT